MQRRRRARCGHLIAAAVLAAGCDGAGDPPVPSKLEFQTEPATAVAGSAIAPAVQVRVLDESGNVFAGSITVTLSLLHLNDAPLLGASSVATESGVATFRDLRIEKAAAGYVLRATAPGVSGATSKSFDVTSAAAATLRFTTQPRNTVAGAELGPSPAGGPLVVTLFDALGNVVTGDAAPVTIALDANPGGAALSGTTTVNAVGGVAAFGGISIQKVGSGYTISASSGSLPPVKSNAFDVAHAPAAKLRFVQQPAPAPAGKPLPVALTVEITDRYDNRATSATNPVTLAFSGAPIPEPTVLGTRTANAVAGVAAFSPVGISRAGTFRLRADAAGLESGTSAAVVVQPTTLARFCPTGPDPFAAFATIFDAIESTEPGGTIAICDGTHDVGSRMNRPLTVRPEHEGMVTLTNRRGFPVFTLDVESGTVRISGLKFEVTGSEAVSTLAYDQLIIENSTFRHIASMEAVSVPLNRGPARNTLVIMRGNTMTGFPIAAHVVRTRMDFLDNRIEGGGWDFASVRYVSSTGTVQRNRFVNCGGICLDAWAAEAGSIEILDNQFDNDVSARTRNALSLSGPVTVRRNRIVGTGGTGGQPLPGTPSFALQSAAIWVSGKPGPMPLIEDNEITNASTGLLVSTADVGATARNNRIANVGWGFNFQSGTVGVYERNDVTGFVFGAVRAAGPIAASLKCNYWGSAAPPQVDAALVPLITPHSPVPIAGRPEVACP